MKITDTERKLLSFLGTQLGQFTKFSSLRPATQTMVKRMRHKGLISKRDRRWVQMTELGKSHRL